MPPRSYIGHPDLQVFPPPIRCDGVHLYAFFAKADPARLQRWVDHWFNEPAGGQLHFRAVGPMVMITFQEITRLQSLDPEAEALGYTSELEACFWLPIAQGPPNEPVAGLAIPWIWPDNSLAVATGRELYGFRKAHAWIRMPTSSEHGHHDAATAAACAAAGSDGAAPFVLDTLSFERFGKDSVARRHETLRIERVDPPSSGPLIELGERITDLKSALEDELGGLAEVANHLNHFANLEVPMLLTKQYRAVASRHDACHLEMTVCHAKDLRFDELHYLLGRWQMVLQPLASQPIAAELGLHADSDGVVALEPISMRIRYSFDLDLGDTIWRMPEPGPPEVELMRKLRRRVEGAVERVEGRVRRWLG